MTIVVTGATGNIGHVITEKLVEAGANVAVIARHPEKLSAAIREKVDVRQGNVNNAVFLADATRDADTLFWLTPPDFSVTDPAAYYRTVGETAAQAIQKNGIKRVVFISSVGAQNPTAGQITGLGVQEKIIGAVTPDFYALRCGFFFENFLMQVESLKGQGAYYSVARPEIPIPMIATKDIGTKAAALLLDTSWTGHHTLGLQGPADLSNTEAAEILSNVLGKQINYVPITEEQAYDALRSKGVNEPVAKAFAELQACLNIPGINAEPRTPETTTSTTLAEWAEAVLKPAIA